MTQTCTVAHVKGAIRRDLISSPHLTTIHKIAIPISTEPKNPHVTPDFKNPTLYCDACEKTYTSKTTYRAHLIQKHKMIPPPYQRRPKLNSGVLPDVNDPNLYCSVCKKNFSNRTYFRFHLENIHNMVLPATPNVNDPNFNCNAYERTFKTKYKYRGHLKQVHKMTLKSISLKIINTALNNAKIDPNDTNNYCNACERKSKDKRNYRYHLRVKHKIKLTSNSLAIIVNPDKTPDPKDPDYFCCTCEKYFSKKSHYCTHLNRVHKMGIQPKILISKKNGGKKSIHRASIVRSENKVIVKEVEKEESKL